MDTLLLYLRFEFSKFRKYFATRKTAKAITAGLFFIVFAFVALGIYSFFISGFRYINYVIEPEFRESIALLIYEVFLLVLAGVIVASALISGLFSLFRGQNDNWIMSSPVYKALPRFVFAKSILSSSWPLVVMFLPAIVAFMTAYRTGIPSLLILIVSVAALLVFTNAITLSVVMIVGRLYYLCSRMVRALRFTFKGFVGLLLGVIAANLGVAWNAISGIDLVQLFKADNADVVVNASTIGSHFAYYPTHPFALAIIDLTGNRWMDALLNTSILVVMAVLGVLLWNVVAARYHYVLWQAFQEGESEPRNEGAVRVRSGYRFGGSILEALFKKEMLVWSRNWKSVLWFLFVSFLWLVQIGASLVMEHNIRRHSVDVSATSATLQAIQFVTAAYFVSAFTLRFVFPAFSVEKKTAWILGTAPISRVRVFLGKYIFYSTFFVLVGLFMNYVNVNVLRLAGGQVFLSMVLLATVIIFTVTLGLLLGAVFPNKESDDPEVISTSMSGLFFTALALLYGAFAAWLLYAGLLSGSVINILLFILVSVVLTAFALFSVPKLLRKTFFD